ncbi:MAG: nicotinate-nucleotide--dimethylbenzimidazole phosphoribosyltransferase [Clostridiales bacterium]|nr:nicotinate-nucleotide--dimethylbenzimidazole phosphoribosyltransferase [Clostridiales bacterium]
MKEAEEHWNTLAKPLGSLGKLEQAVIQIAGISRTENVDISKKGLIIMCADNGVVSEGVTQTGREVTAVVAENFLNLRSCVAIMCRDAGADIFPVDIGMAADVPGIDRRKVAYGTKNMYREPAMSRDEAIAAIEVGIQFVKEKAEAGYQILAAGEMGIGNTTASSAVTSVLLDVPVEEVTGRGAGLTGAGLARKIEVIQAAVAEHRPDPRDPIDVLAKVGGFDLAGLAGVFLGGAMYHIPVVADGFISTVSALVAIRLNPGTADYILPSHVSKEPAGEMLLQAMGKTPFLTCDMRLGEGSGAVALFPLLDMAVHIYQEMIPFSEAGFGIYLPLV